MTSAMKLQTRVTPAATDDTGRRAIFFDRLMKLSSGLRRMHLEAARCVALASRVDNGGTGAGTGNLLNRRAAV